MLQWQDVWQVGNDGFGRWTAADFWRSETAVKSAEDTRTGPNHQLTRPRFTCQNVWVLTLLPTTNPKILELLGFLLKLTIESRGQMAKVERVSAIQAPYPGRPRGAPEKSVG